MSQTYYQRNRDRRLLQMKKYYKNNKESRSEFMKGWRGKNKEKVRGYVEKYRCVPENKFNTYRRDAAYREISWDLSFEEFMTFWQKPCVICGCVIETVGLDRIDNNLGYTFNNIRSMCKKHNYMRSKYSDEEILVLADGLRRWKGA